MIKYINSNVTLMVANVGKSVKFYTEVLGLKLKLQQGPFWAEVQAKGITLGLHLKMKGKPVKNGDNMAIGLEVSDIKAAMKELEAKGLTFAYRKGVISTAYFNDPDDNVLYLVQQSKK